MPLSFAEWKDKLKARWQAWARDPQAALERLGVNVLYFGLAGTALFPIAEAFARGDYAAFAMLGSLGAGVGVNLIANAVQNWANESDAAQQLAAASHNHPELIEALDVILHQLEAPREVVSGLTDADREWFVRTLREEATEFGSKIVIDQQSGGVNIAAERVTARDIVGGDYLVNSTKIVYAGEDPQAAQALLNGYLKWLVGECKYVKLIGIDQGAARPDRQPLGLTSVYVDLNLDFQVPAKTTLAKHMTAARGRDARAKAGEEREASRPTPALEALAYHSSLVLLGRPGSGKSTLSAYLALSLAEAGLGSDAALSRLNTEWAYGEKKSERLRVEWTHGPLLPVRVVLRQFAAGLPADLKEGRAAHLWKFIADELINCGLPEKTGRLIRDVAHKSGALFLFDGLDETGDEARRARVLEAVAEFTRSAGDQCRFLLTARPYAWESAEQRIAGIPAVYRLADFDAQQIHTFIARWYEATSAIGWINATVAAEKIPDLQQAVQRADLFALARNPLLLALMVTLHGNRTRLPDDRADLYNEVVELLIQRWNESIGADRSLLGALDIPQLTLAHLREKIEKLAFDAHARHVGKEGTADLSETELREAFKPLLGSWDKADLVVEYIEKRAGLLLGQGPRGGARQFTFPHRTFQEFLAACHLAAQADFSERAKQCAETAPGHWREVLALAARHAGPSRGVPAADALIHAHSIEEYRRKAGTVSEVDWRLANVAGAQLMEIGLAVLGQDPYSAARERVAGWLQALIETPRLLSLQERVEAGDTLGRLGDPRFPIRKAADGTEYIFPPAVRVDAGPFDMGSHKDEPGTFDDEYSDKTKGKRHRVDVAAFDLGPYPVTNAEYRCFIRSTGREAPDRWINGEVPQGRETHPVVNVSWRDAVAYCEWLSKVSGRIVRLPTEAEWEKAACWDKEAKHSRIYPWSDKWDEARCNTAEAGLYATTPVGLYPDGASPSGALDMAGNVWEWTSSLYKPYPYDVLDGREDLASNGSRVVRGGSWLDDHGYCRAAYRLRGDPAIFYYIAGFRVVRSPVGS